MSKEYSDKTLNKLHQVLLEILDEFVRICDKHNLVYFMVGGTFLGAVRHSGFIPWDDDMDLGMPRSDYEKFIEIAKKELNKKYYLDCFQTNEDYHLPYAKIKKNKTVFDEERTHHLNNHKGIFIDIFPLDNVKENNLNLKIRAIMALSITDAVAYKLKIKKLKELKHPIISFLLSVYTRKYLMKIQKRIVTYCHDDNSKYMCDIGAGYGYRKELILREEVLPVKKMKFENKEYSVPKTDTHLKQLYGDYMKLPPKEKRKTHSPMRIEFGEENEI
jgi:lipopolysaccharide cholinephosphotransferase